MTAHELAWKVIDRWVANDYDGDKSALEYEVGDLSEYAYRIAGVIENEDLLVSFEGEEPSDGDLAYISATVEMAM